jgi:hypothetical protein
MASKYRDEFFLEKRHWSHYKDTVLDYYLKPYLQKVKGLGRPIAAVDMFAGRGEFSDGSPGSPLIIARRLQDLKESQCPFSLTCFEQHPPFAVHLKQTLAGYKFASVVEQDCLQCLADINTVAKKSTTFLYLDPFNASQLDLNRLGLLFDNVKTHSVEVIIVFMARGFMREAARVVGLEQALEKSGALNDSLVSGFADDASKMLMLGALYGEEAGMYSQKVAAEGVLSGIIGNDGWKDVVASGESWEEKCWQLVELYQRRLKSWFSTVETFPIRADAGTPLPQYWLVFGSRYEPAFELFNRGACEARRAQMHNYRKPDTLFADIARPREGPSESKVNQAVLVSARQQSGSTWEALRRATSSGRNVGVFTDAEVNAAIKRLLRSGRLAGASGDKIDDRSKLSLKG